MTLRQQFSLLTSVLIIVLLCGSLAVTAMNGRDHFEQLLNARAYDAATSLALSLSQVDSDDTVQQSRMIDVLFDRGFYQEITLIRSDGETLHRRSRDALVNSAAPAWFISLVPLQLLPAETDVTRGWQRLGNLTVISHPDFAYRDLWQMVRSESTWFGWVLIVSLLSLQLILRVLFRPLQSIEQQAMAISERDLQVQETLPKARELRSVVLAMNHMVRKLRAIFDEQARMTERLRQESYHDEATGLLNRRGFDQRLEHLLMGSDEHSGVLMILQVQKFADYNLRVGRLAGDELLKTLGKTLDQRCSELPQSFVGRRSGADIGLFFPCTDPAQADEFMQQLSSLLRMSVLPLREGVEFHVGGVFLQGKKDDPVLALSQADVALRQAQRQPKGCCVLYQSDDIQRIEWSAGDWRNVLKETLSKGAIELQFLPVINNVNTVTQLEVFSRLQWHDQTLSAARFWPMVEHHRLSSQFDLAIVNKVFTHLNNLTSVPKNVRVCINISPASIIDEDFQHQLIDLLQMYPRYTSLISLEIPEFALANVEVALTKLAPRLKLLGVELGIDQVGTGSMAFAYLQRLPLSYIRVDGSFNRGVHLSQDHRFFVQSMVQIAHNLDLQVMAEGLEQEEDVITVRATGIDGVGGYYFSQPMPALQDVLDWTKKG